MKRISIILIVVFAVAVMFGQIRYFPSPQTILSSGFGEYRPSSSGLLPHFHMGVDFPTFSREGVEIRSVDSGYLYKIEIDDDSIYGYTVYIKHENYISLYAHLSKFATKARKIVESLIKEFPNRRVEVMFPDNEIFVQAGEVIGYSGRTGEALAPHCHLELRDLENKVAINPIPVLSISRPYDLKIHIGSVRVDGETYPATNGLVVPIKTAIPKIDVLTYITFDKTFINPHVVSLEVNGREVYKVEFDSIKLSEFAQAPKVYGRDSTMRKYWFRMYSDVPLSVVKVNEWNNIPELPARSRVTIRVRSDWDDEESFTFELVRR